MCIKWQKQTKHSLTLDFNTYRIRIELLNFSLGKTNNKQPTTNN